MNDRKVKQKANRIREAMDVMLREAGIDTKDGGIIHWCRAEIAHVMKETIRIQTLEAAPR